MAWNLFSTGLGWQCVLGQAAFCPRFLPCAELRLQQRMFIPKAWRPAPPSKIQDLTELHTRGSSGQRHTCQFNDSWLLPKPVSILLEQADFHSCGIKWLMSLIGQVILPAPSLCKPSEPKEACLSMTITRTVREIQLWELHFNPE